MAYNKTTWIDDVTPLDAEHLNNMEDGIEKMYKATINGKALSDNPSLTATDVGALSDSTEIPIVDKKFSANSENAQSGIAVAEAIEPKADKQEVANALKVTTSGSALNLNDVSPVEHTMKVKLRGKNLFDKSIPFSTWEVVGGGYSKLSITVPIGSKVTASVFKKYATDEKNGHLYVRISGKDYWLFHEGQAGLCKKSVTATSADGIVDVIMTAKSYNSFKDEFMVEINGEATDYTPYISDYTAVSEKQWQQVFSSYCEFTGSSQEFYLAPVYKPKTFDIVVGREYTLETSGGMQGPNGLKYTCTAVENSYGGHSIKGDKIRVETCSEEYAQQQIAAGFPEYSEWINKFRIAWVPTTYSYVDFKLTIKEYAGTITKAVKLIKTNADGTVSEEYTSTADGTVNGVTSLYPCTKLSTDMDDITIYCEYNRDINKFNSDVSEVLVRNQPFKLIEKITLQEDAAIDRNQTPDGEDYNFNEMKIVIKFSNPTSNVNLYCNFFVDKYQAASSVGALYLPNAGLSGRVCYATYTAKISPYNNGVQDNNYIADISASSSNPGASPVYSCGLFSTYQENSIPSLFENYTGKFKRFKLEQMPAGTIIYIIAR